MARFVLSAFADEAGSSLAEQIAALRENEIDYIEPRKINKKGILSFSNSEIREIKNELDKNGIKVNSLGSPIGKYPIDSPFDLHFAEAKRAFEICNLLGTENIRIFSFFTTQNRLADDRAEVFLRLKILADAAKKYGVTLCHENESKIYGQMPNEVLDILRSVPEIKGIFDPANYIMNGADVIEGINATFENFKYMHVKDAIHESQTVVPAGEGEGKIGEIIDMINEHTDKLVYLTLEPHLHIFDAYKDIDDHELRGKYVFNSGREAFDCAVASLKKILKERGYSRNGENEWIK